MNKIENEMYVLLLGHLALLYLIIHISEAMSL